MSDARDLLAAGLRRCIDDALAREPGLTRAELAVRMVPGCSPSSAASTVRTYLARGRWPGPEQLDQMADGLGVTVADLFKSDPNS